ncbi:MAG: hypothetical protein F4228_02880 [Acidobacteria bacterium]|nr:hypothetical protein [Acidobacteriota bacterium]MYF13627.1 hypothetical protein [Acidobacteriota bacterium]MYI95383.1 hypothetical protein [Acidobacteriota bacterium]
MEPRPEVVAAPLLVRQAGGAAPGKFLCGLNLSAAESRREGLARLAAWSRDAGVSAVVLEEGASALIPDLRALGFDDAGPLPRYSSPVRPGWLRRVAPALLLPRARTMTDVTVVPEALSDSEEGSLRERLAPDFGAVAGFPAGGPFPTAGVHLVRAGRPVASCRFEPEAEGALAVPWWIAPPREPDLTALLAGGALRAAGSAASVSFETPHRLLARGLFLARFLPRRSRARVLVRQHGARDLPAPSIADWHLSTATVVQRP